MKISRLTLVHFMIFIFCLIRITNAQKVIISNYDTYYEYNVPSKSLQIYECDLPKDGLAYSYQYHPIGWYQSTSPNRQYLNDENKWESYAEHYRIDYITCLYDTITQQYHEINSPHQIYYIDYLGGVYYESLEKDNISIYYSKSIFENSAELIYKTPATYRPKDIIKYKSNYYVFYFSRIIEYRPQNTVEIGTNRVDVLDENFQLLYHFYAPKTVLNLTTVFTSCDSVEVYAVGYDFDLEDNDSTFYGVEAHQLHLYKYDLEGNHLEHLTELGERKWYSVIYITSESEFLATDPNCDLKLDLDYDNSSGVLPYDFKYSQIICRDQSLAVADEDANLHSTFGLDSTTFRVEGFDSELDFVISYDEGDSLLVLQRGSEFTVSSKYGLVVSNEEYLRFIKSINIQNKSNTPGVKKVVFTLFSMGEESPTASFLFENRETYSSGSDAELSVCKDTVVVNLSETLNGDQRGEWIPKLTSGSDVFDSRLDTSSMYLYITSDSLCPPDTAELSIIRDVQPGNTFSVESCNLDTIWIDLEVDVDENFEWEDGNQDNPRAVLPHEEESVQTYYANIYSSEGCTHRDTFLISAKLVPSEETVAVCKGASFEFDGTSYPPGSSFSSVKRSEVGGCDTIQQVSVVELPLPEPMIEGEEIVCFGQKTTLSTGNFQDYEWSDGSTGRTIEVGPGKVSVKVLDEFLCEGTAEITITERPEWIIDLLDSLKLTGQGNYLIEFVNDPESQNINVESENGLEVTLTGDNEIRIVSEIEGNYQLIFTDEVGCIVKKDLTLYYPEDEELLISNIIMPSSQLPENSVWHPIAQPGSKIESVSIYDRWGNQVFYTTTEMTWDGKTHGKKVTAGVYVYLIQYSQGDNDKVVSGTITIID